MDADGSPDDTNQENGNAADSNATKSERSADHTDDKTAASKRVPLVERMFTRPISVIRNCFWRTVYGLKAIDGLITAVATAIVAVATIFLYCATQALVEDARKSGEANARAWIVPTGASFFEPPTTDYFRIRIDIQNTGKESALDVRQTDIDSITPEYRTNQFGKPYIDSNNIPWPRDKTCELKSEEPIGPIYPNEQTYYIRQGFGAEHFADLIRGVRIIIVSGCFLYEDTFHGKRQSPYCFYSVPTPPKPFRDWTFAPCLKRTEEPK